MGVDPRRDRVKVRVFATVEGPDCGRLHPFEATPWANMMLYPTPWGWSVFQAFLNRSLAVSRAFRGIIHVQNAWLHTVAMGNDDF